MTNMINVISMLHNITYNSMNVKKKDRKPEREIILF